MSIVNEAPPEPEWNEPAATNTLAIPHSRDAEEATIGSVLINSDVYYDVSQFLKADDFYIHRNKWIWEAFVRMNKRKTPIDLLTLSEELGRMGQLDEAGGPAYLTSLINQVPSSLNAEFYGRMVHGYSIRRKLINSANRIAMLAYDQKLEIDAVQKQTWTEIESVTTNTSTGLRPIGQIVGDVYDKVNARSRLVELAGIPTGFIDLDKLLGNLQDEDFIVIAGRPGLGKTGLLLDIAKHNTVDAKPENRKKVAIFEMEMSDESIAHRIISKMTGIDSQRIRTGRLHEHEWTLFTHAVEQLADSGLFIDDTPSVTPLQLLARAKSQQMREGLDLIIVDYLQLQDGSGDIHSKKNDNRVQEVSYVSRMLKLTARALKVPVLAAAQLNRALEQRSNKRPILSDLRESGSIEQDADIVMFIYRDDMYDKKDAKQNIAEIIVAKHRNGPVGSVELVFRSATAQFGNAATRVFKTAQVPSIIS